MSIRSRIFPTVIAVLAVLGLRAHGSDPLVLGVDQAVELALSDNLGLQAQQLAARSDERAYLNRFNVLIPTVSASATLIRPNREPEAPQIPGVPPDPGAASPPRWNLRTGVDASLTLSLQILDGIQASRLAFEDARLSLAVAARDIEIGVRSAFYQLLLQQEQLQLSEARFESGVERIADLEGQFEAGFIDEFTLLTQQVGVENQRPALRRQRDAVQAALRRFADTIGIDPDTPIRLDGSIQDAFMEIDDLRGLLDRVTDASAVEQARRQRQQLVVARQATVSSLFPTVTLSWGVNPVLGADPFNMSELVDRDNWTDNGAFSVTIRQPIDPFLRWSATRVRLADQADQIEQAAISVTRTERQVRLEVIGIIEQLETITSGIESLQSNIRLAERALELANEGFEAGLRTLSAVEDAELDLRNAQFELLQEQSRFVDNILTLENTLGFPLPGMETSE